MRTEIRTTTNFNNGIQGIFEQRGGQIAGFTYTFGIIKIDPLIIVTVNNNEAWRKKIGEITQNAEYDIIPKN
jgi:hypothetical protein